MRSWIEKKSALCELIKQITEFHDGEYEDDYAQDIIVENRHNIDETILLFEKLLSQAKVVNFNLRRKA